MAKTLLVAAATLSLIAGGGWALQAVSLARPTVGQLELGRVLHALRDAVGTPATLTVDGQRYSARCMRGSGVALRDGVLERRDVPTGAGLIVIGRTRPRTTDPSPCSDAAISWLSTELADGAPVRIRALRDGDGLGTRLDLERRRRPPLLMVVGGTSGLRLTAVGAPGAAGDGGTLRS